MGEFSNWAIKRSAAPILAEVTGRPGFSSAVLTPDNTGNPSVLRASGFPRAGVG